jgi:DNA-binding MarR family transcriptional regulator
MTILTFPRARNTDPVTSLASADQADRLSAHHYELIIQALKFGSMGCSGIAFVCGLHKSQVARRLSELESRGRIKLTGYVVKSNSNRFEREWKNEQFY